jgi:hypothetical protein
MKFANVERCLAWNKKARGNPLSKTLGEITAAGRKVNNKYKGRGTSEGIWLMSSLQPGRGQ